MSTRYSFGLRASSAPSVPAAFGAFGCLGEVSQLFSFGVPAPPGPYSVGPFVVEHTPPDPPGESAARENEVTPCVRHVTWITEFPSGGLQVWRSKRAGVQTVHGKYQLRRWMRHETESRLGPSKAAGCPHHAFRCMVSGPGEQCQPGCSRHRTTERRDSQRSSTD